MRFRQLVSLGLLALVDESSAAAMGSGDAYIDNLPFKVVKVIPKTIFATDPPMEGCANGLVHMLADALMIDRQVMDDLINSVLGALEGLGLDLGGILGRSQTPGSDKPPARDSTSSIPNFFAGVPVKDFKLAMDNMLSRTPKDKVTQRPAYDSSSAFTGIWGLHSNMVAVVEAIEALGTNPKIAKFVALGALAAQAQYTEDPILDEVLNALVTSLEESKCANVVEGDDPGATLCPMFGSVTDRNTRAARLSNVISDMLNGMGIDLDIEALPDLFTGFATSRAVSSLVYYVVGQLQFWLGNAGGATASISLDLDMTPGNLGAGACRSVGISRDYDFDPIWASCALATAIGAVMGCGTTGLGPECSKAPEPPTPNWSKCDRIYSPNVNISATDPMPLRLLRPDSLIDANGNMNRIAIGLEGHIYYFLFSAAIAHGGYTSPQQKCGLLPNPVQLVPGWNRVLDLWTTQEGDAVFDENALEYFPLTSLSKMVDYVVPWSEDGNPAPDGTGIVYTLEPINSLRPECWTGHCWHFKNGAAQPHTAVESCIKFQPRHCRYRIGFELVSADITNASPEWTCNNVGNSGQYLMDISPFWQISTYPKYTSLPAIIQYKAAIGNMTQSHELKVTTASNIGINCISHPLYSFATAPGCSDVESQGPPVVNVSAIPAQRQVMADGALFHGRGYLGIGVPTLAWGSCGSRPASLSMATRVRMEVTGADYHSTSTPQEKGACDFLITQRGTSSAYEWSVNFDAGLVPGYNSTDGATIHQGYRRYADAVMPVMDEFIRTEYLETGICDPQKTVITITGHSLGGGVAEVFANYITNSETYDGMTKELVTFAPAHGLSREATESLRAHANVRSIVGEYDLVPNFPCSKGGGLMRCNSRNAGILYGEGYDQPYGEHINQITITADMMSVIDKRFVDMRFVSAGFLFSVLNPDLGLQPAYMNLQMPATINAAAWHVCSYACWTSHTFCTTKPDEAWMCDDCPSLTGIGFP